MMDGEYSDGGEASVISENALAVISRAEADIQISTAKKYPRSITQSLALAESMATISVETAASCFYKIPRDGKLIEGPSVRMAEIFASAWGNMRFGARIISEDDRFITAQGVAHDMQNNVAATIEIRRRITGKNGKKYGDDMIGVTGNAACAIAMRNAVFKVIPKSYINVVYEKAKLVAVGNAKTLVERRDAMLAYLTTKVGVPIDRILGRLERPHENDITVSDLETLHGLATAIKDQETTIDAAFPPIVEDAPAASAETGPGSKAENLAKSINPPAAAKPEPKAEQKPPAETFPPPKPPEKSAQAEQTTASNVPAIPNLASWPDFEAAVNELAMDHGIESGKTTSALNTLRLGAAGTARSSGEKERQRVYLAMLNGQFNWQTASVLN